MRCLPFLETLRIQAKGRGVIPLNPNWAQTELLEAYERAEDEQRPCRIIVLKSRQLGISTVSEALIFKSTVSNAGTNSVVVAHDGSSSEHLFNMTRHYYDTWKYKQFYPVKYATRRQLSFSDIRSNIYVMTAEHSQAGHGRTLHNAHFSEVAMWREPEDAFAGFNPAIPYLPGTTVILESTAKGMGNFWDELWQSSVAGESGYEPLFFPWFRHYEYIPCENAFCMDATCERCRDESRITPQDDEEHRLLGLGATIAHIAWRRRALHSRCFGDEDFFREQYCATPEEAFRTTGVNAFPMTYLEKVYKPVPPMRGRLELDYSGNRVRFVDDAQGPLRLYVQPGDASWGKYFVGADPCHGTVDGDYAAAQVISRQSHEQVAVWHGRINPMAFADELVKLGRFYNNAMISVETDGPGYATIGRLTSLYNNIWAHRTLDRRPGKQMSGVSMSWQSNWKRKQWMVAKLSEWIEREDITIHDTKTFNELRGYTFFGEKGYGDVFGPSSKTAHDDLVMSLGIAVTCEATEPGVEYDESDRQVPPFTDLNSLVGAPLTHEDAYEAWDG